MNCIHKIKIKSVRFFSGKPAYFCLIQKSKHPMLIAVGNNKCKECANCSKFTDSDKVEEYLEEESDARFGIWEFYGPNENFKYKTNEEFK